MADLESRISTVEYKVDEHGRRIVEVEDDIKCVKQDCTAEKIVLGKLDEKFDGLVDQMTLLAATNKESMTLIKTIIIVLATIIVALLGVFGIKVALPNIT